MMMMMTMTETGNWFCLKKNFVSVQSKNLAQFNITSWSLLRIILIIETTHF